LRTLLQLFIKYPYPGQVKTRLSGLLGEDGAANLHRELAERQLAQIALLSPRITCELWCNEAADAPWYADLQQRWPRLRYRRQAEGPLGERLRFALQRAMPFANGVVQIGCDCPVLSAQHIANAAQALDQNYDSALIGAEDGGYVLAGYTGYSSALFESIDWSTSQVFEQTLNQFRREGLQPVVYPPLWDVDRDEDYQRYCQLLDNTPSAVLMPEQRLRRASQRQGAH